MFTLRKTSSSMWWDKMKTKKRLTQAQEFEIMLLVLDKFLWLGFGVMAFAVWQMFRGQITDGIMMLIGGVVLLILFVWLIIKEYEIIK